MIRSMTGFARTTRRGDWGELTLELRAVNHRFLDVKLSLPDGLQGLAEDLRAQLQKRLTRGRIEASVRWRPPAVAGFAINRELARAIAAELRSLQEEIGAAGEAPPLDLLRLLAWPGVVETATPESRLLSGELAAACDAALDELVAAREREGAALAGVLEERLQRLAAGLEACTAEERAAKVSLGERLAERIAALGAAADAARIAQEAAILVVRQDASEELERLAMHVREVRRLLRADEAAGRRLDFLMQELMREANTLASKAADVAVNRRALDFKVLIEEMREQVQNVE
ncbi:MAG TPA: YicC/YloC family endoribonuclease [Gammaproteobacteria bacterium]|nr:YicC/YloC family endoribonuclease [Gammaproteobacteria bacterium]